jgi:hypothetical protein
MTEILTESFCERCGTRYTFETARPQNSRIKRAKTFTKGLRNYVLSDDSFSEAMADARGEEELAATVLQLDAFHKTFNFCMSCRQYTCGNCWNTEEGRCLSCAPLPGAVPGEDLEPTDSAVIADRLAAISGPAVEAHAGSPEIGIAAWPAADLLPQPPLPGEREEQVPPAEGAPTEPVSPAAGSVAGAESVEAAEAAEASPGVVEAPGAPAPGVAETELADSQLPALQGLRPGESLEDAIAAYEATHALDEGAQPAAAIGEEPLEPLAPVTPEAIEAETLPETGSAMGAAMGATELLAEPAVEDATPTPATAPAAEAIADAPAPPPAEVQVEAAGTVADEPATGQDQAETAAFAAPDSPTRPTFPLAPPPPPQPIEPPILATPAAAPAAPAPPVEPERVAASATPLDAAAPASPETQPEPSPGWLTVAPDDGSAPAWPQRRSWPAATRPMEGATLAGRRLLPSSDATAMWAASAREVLQDGPPAAHDAVGHAASPTAQPCVGCGLSLSANARFCRRCGARQA